MHWVTQTKKLVSVLATCTLVTGAKNSQKMRVLHWISCFCYPVQFWKHKSKDVLAFLNFRSELNEMTLAYAVQLGFKVQKIDVDAQKIDGFLLETYGMVIAIFQVFNKLHCSWLFQKTLLLANIIMKMVLDMFFLTLSNVNTYLAKKKLTWKTYITNKALSTNCQVEFIDWKEFAKVALDKNIDTFVVYVSSLRSKITIYPAKEA